ncbi:MBL fold metallo-hydrolase [Candidatus Bipolaricaulota bacterium]|nr:MBL fold metallo-hydrolase [Candidatus Bipolaricaulota bacterium]
MTRVVPINLSMVKSFLIAGDDKGLVLVDAGNPGDGEKIIQKVENAGYRPQDISLIVITHGHRDHVGGLEELSRRLPASVIIHEKDSSAITKGEGPPTVPLGLKGRLLEPFASGPELAIEGVRPKRITEGSVNLHCFGVSGEVIHTPGHTEGSLSIVLEDGKAIIGDLVMGRFLLFGGASFPVFAVDPTSVRESIKKILSMGVEKVYTSHGGPYRTKDLKRLI